MSWTLPTSPVFGPDFNFDQLTAPITQPCGRCSTEVSTIYHCGGGPCPYAEPELCKTCGQELKHG